MRPFVSSRPGMGCPTGCRPQSIRGTQIRLPGGGGLSLSALTDSNLTHTIAQHAGWPTTRQPNNSPQSSSRRRYSRLSAGGSSLLPSTPCYAPTRTTPGHGSAHAADGLRQNSRTAHLPHPQIPAASSQPAPHGPGPPPQTPVLQTVRT